MLLGPATRLVSDDIQLGLLYVVKRSYSKPVLEPTWVWFFDETRASESMLRANFEFHEMIL